jgi:glucose-1-phosphate cytidylyltransferase
MTGGRLRKVRKYLEHDDAFCFTYGDGLSDINIRDTIDFHKKHGKKATITSAYPPGRFGALEIDKKKVLNFQEKPQGDGGMINAGYFILSPAVFKYLDGDFTIWEHQPLIQLVSEGELMAFEHYGFWQPMDTLRDKELLEKLWFQGKAPWKKW